jgi:hypothetical protein
MTTRAVGLGEVEITKQTIPIALIDMEGGVPRWSLQFKVIRANACTVTTRVMENFSRWYWSIEVRPYMTVSTVSIGI